MPSLLPERMVLLSMQLSLPLSVTIVATSWESLRESVLGLRGASSKSLMLREFSKIRRLDSTAWTGLIVTSLAKARAKVMASLMEGQSRKL